jgi:hypothetical protein
MQEIGPSLPPGFKRNKSPSPSNEHFENKQIYIGPALPPGFKRKYSDNETSESEESEFGPEPVAENEREYYQERDKRIRMEEINNRNQKKSKEEKLNQRPDWMIKPPDKMNPTGKLMLIIAAGDFKGRSFQRKATESRIDYELWTANPCERERMIKESKCEKSEVIPKTLSKRDQEYREIVDAHNV